MLNTSERIIRVEYTKHEPLRPDQWTVDLAYVRVDDMGRGKKTG